MIEKPNDESSSEFAAEGLLTKKGVRVAEKGSIASLSQRGYGTEEDEVFNLAFYEAMYLLDKQLLNVKDEHGNAVDFHRLLQLSEKVDENAWVKYLVYRDLRSR